MMFRPSQTTDIIWCTIALFLFLGDPRIKADFLLGIELGEFILGTNVDNQKWFYPNWLVIITFCIDYRFTDYEIWNFMNKTHIYILCLIFGVFIIIAAL